MERTQEMPPFDRHDTFDFRQITVHLDEAPKFDNYFQHADADVVLAEGPRLAMIECNRLQTSYDNFDNSMSLDAIIHCRVDQKGRFDEDWQTTLLEDVEDYYNALAGYTCYSLEHEPDALYIQRHYQPRILYVKTLSDSDCCSVNISLLPNNDETVSQKLDYQTLYDVTQAWAKVQNSLFTHFVPEWSDKDYDNVWVSPPAAVSDDGVSEAAFSIEDETPPVPPYPAREALLFDEPAAAFDKVGGLFKPVARLKAIAHIFTDEVGRRRYNISAPPFILQGEPGTGKNTLIEAFCKAVSAKLIIRNASSLQSKMHSGTAQNINRLFDEATVLPGRVVVCIDEIETIIGKANHEEAAIATKALGALIDAAKHHPNILIVGTMNAHPSDVTESIIRPGRFEVITIDKSANEDEIIDTWYTLITELESPFDDADDSERMYDRQLDIASLARETLDCSGADIAAILEDARTVKYFEDAARNDKTSSTPITTKDLRDAIRRHKQRP